MIFSFLGLDLIGLTVRTTLSLSTSIMFQSKVVCFLDDDDDDFRSILGGSMLAFAFKLSDGDDVSIRSCGSGTVTVTSVVL